MKSGPKQSKFSFVLIGSRFGDAFQEPSSFLTIKPLFESERYMVTYNPSKDKIYALLKDQAKSDDILKAAYHAHVLLHYINSTKQKNTDFTAQLAESCRVVSSSYGAFKYKAKEQGWIISDALLNPGRA
ncbi:protein root UVB sensitive 6-like [Carex rostrata]